MPITMIETRNSITDIWGERTPYDGKWPERVDERLLEEPERWVQSTCFLCSTCCAMDIGVKSRRTDDYRLGSGKQATPF